MIKNNFWFITLCALLAISANSESNVFFRIALFANSIVVLLEVAKEIRRLAYGTIKKKN